MRVSVKFEEFTPPNPTMELVRTPNKLFIFANGALLLSLEDEAMNDFCEAISNLGFLFITK